MKKTTFKYMAIGAALAVFCGCASAQNGAHGGGAGGKSAIKNAVEFHASEAELAAASSKEAAALVQAKAVAMGCFELLLRGDGGPFYASCVLQLTEGVAAEIRQSRWDRVAKAAARKVGAAGGVLEKSAECAWAGDRANCRIRYELALEPSVREVVIPLKRDEAGKWKIYR